MSSDVKPDSILTFDLEEGVLSSGENEVRLNRQGIRCFELLTKHPDVVISKDEFIEQCWKKYGYLVTDNSVRQTFFQLRRALDEIGAPPDTLITIPKKGYKLSPDVSFVILNADARSGTEDQAQNKIQEQQDQSVDPLPVAVPAIRSRTNFWWVVLGVIMSFSSGLFLRYEFMITPVTYAKYASRGEISYYFQNEYRGSKAEAVNRVEKWLANAVLSQKPVREVYVNISQDHNLSLFLCTSQIDAPDARCITMNVLGKNK